MEEIQHIWWRNNSESKHQKGQLGPPVGDDENDPQNEASRSPSPALAYLTLKDSFG